jgi:hypothetical protein
MLPQRDVFGQVVDVRAGQLECRFRVALADEEPARLQRVSQAHERAHPGVLGESLFQQHDAQVARGAPDRRGGAGCLLDGQLEVPAAQDLDIAVRGPARERRDAERGVEVLVLGESRRGLLRGRCREVTDEERRARREVTSGRPGGDPEPPTLAAQRLRVLLGREEVPGVHGVHRVGRPDGDGAAISRDAAQEALEPLPVQRGDHRAARHDVVDLPDEAGLVAREEGGDRSRELPVRARARLDVRSETRGEERECPIAPPPESGGARERFALHLGNASVVSAPVV